MEKGSKEWYIKGGYHSWLSTETYKSVVKGSPYHHKRLLKWLEDINFGKISKGKDVLEVAFNNGKTVFWALEKYGQVFNVSMFDFDTNVIKWAKEQNKKWEIDIFESDVENIQKEDSGYDIVFCLDVIEHLRDAVYLRMIKELYRVLRKGGIVIVFIGKGNASGHLNKLSDEESIEDFNRAGFKLVNRKDYFIMKK